MTSRSIRAVGSVAAATATAILAPPGTPTAASTDAEPRTPSAAAMKSLITKANTGQIRRQWERQAEHSLKRPSFEGPITEVGSGLAEVDLPSLSAAVLNSRALRSGLSRYTIRAKDWLHVRAYPGSFSVGLAKNDWGVDVSFDYPGWRKPDARYPFNRSLHYFGYIAGSVKTPIQKCLWIEVKPLTPARAGATHNCTSASALSIKDFMVAWNGHPRDGTDAQINGDLCPLGAPVFSNVQPWRPKTGRVGQGLYVIPPNATVKWRYTTKDFRAVNMRYEGNRNGVAQDWGFIPTRCLRPPPDVNFKLPG